jgi:hypothetical protein
LKSVFVDLPLAINTFRWSVKTFLPELTNAAWISKKKDIIASQPGITRKQFNYDINRAKYNKEWGTNYHKPGFDTYAMAFVIKFLPKVGLARILKFRPPTQPAEALFLKSFTQIVSDYSVVLRKYETHSLQLDNINFDTGKKASPCEYSLVDDTYKQLLLKLPTQPIKQVNDKLRENILDFYANILPYEKSDNEEKKFSNAIAWLKSGK